MIEPRWRFASLSVMVAIAATYVLTACDSLDYHGTVWDESTKKPLQGAMVVATYSRLAGGFVNIHFASYCYRSVLVTTGIDGRYSFPHDVRYGKPIVVAFKPNYIVGSTFRFQSLGAKKTDLALKLNPYETALDYPRFKEPEKVRESARKNTYLDDYPDGDSPHLSYDPFMACSTNRISTRGNDAQAWVELYKALLKEEERLEYPKYWLDGTRATLTRLKAEIS